MGFPRQSLLLFILRTHVLVCGNDSFSASFTSLLITPLINWCCSLSSLPTHNYLSTYSEAAWLTRQVVPPLLGTRREHGQQVWCSKNYKCAYINTFSGGEPETMEYKTHLSHVQQMGWGMQKPAEGRRIWRQTLVCLGNADDRNFCAKSWRHICA